MGTFMHNIIRPIVMPIIVAAVTAGAIIGFGSAVLAAHEPGDKDRFGRPELWLALGVALVILFLFGFLTARPSSASSPLSKDMVVGKKPFFFSSKMDHTPTTARSGDLGSVLDITAGYTLYAQRGALATALGTLPGGSDHGKNFAGYIYAKGLTGASPELWIPYEAIMSVYPETRSAFLSIKGDETEAFGWNVPPESIRRGPERKQSSL